MQAVKIPTHIHILGEVVFCVGVFRVKWRLGNQMARRRFAKNTQQIVSLYVALLPDLSTRSQQESINRGHKEIRMPS